MRIITHKRLQEYAASHPNARSWLEHWYKIARGARWRNLAEVRTTFPHADAVATSKGKTTTIFNVCGNEHRLITAIHYRSGIVFILMVMTHAEYAKGKWRTRL